jgi:hypothetical protein
MGRTAQAHDGGERCAAEQFEDTEKRVLGESGFEGAVKVVATLETAGDP